MLELGRPRPDAGMPGNCGTEQSGLTPEARTGLEASLREAAKGMPHGSKFSFAFEAGHLRIDFLRVPRIAQPGTGTAFLCQVFALADAAGVGTLLLAHPCDEPKEAEVFHLVRWCARFGAEFRRVSVGGKCVLARPPHVPPDGPDAIMARYSAAKVRSDLDERTFLRQWDVLSAAAARAGGNVRRG